MQVKNVVVAIYTEHEETFFLYLSVRLAVVAGLLHKGYCMK